MYILVDADFSNECCLNDRVLYRIFGFRKLLPPFGTLCPLLFDVYTGKENSLFSLEPALCYLMEFWWTLRLC